jgi:hypothetical protein
MGSRVSLPSGAAPRPPQPPPRRRRYSVRCCADGVTPLLLDGIRRSRAAGALLSVTVDCRTCCDAAPLDALAAAAGAHKLVLVC